MGLLQPFIANLELASNQLDRVAMNAIKDNENYILLLVKEQQLGKGLDSEGKNILHPKGNSSGTYQPATENYWAKKNPKPRTSKRTGNKFDMEWTGATKDSMKVITARGGFDIDSSRKRAIEAIYGTKMFALMEKHSKLINEKIIEPAIYEHIFKAFG